MRYRNSNPLLGSLGKLYDLGAAANGSECEETYGHDPALLKICKAKGLAATDAAVRAQNQQGQNGGQQGQNGGGQYDQGGGQYDQGGGQYDQGGGDIDYERDCSVFNDDPRLLQICRTKGSDAAHMVYSRQGLAPTKKVVKKPVLRKVIAKKTDYTPFIIGGVVVVGAVAAFFLLQKKK